jgi:putative transposase
MGQAKSPSFVTEMPLRANQAEERDLLTGLEAARRVYNACLGEALRRLARLRQSVDYRTACKMPQGKPRSRAFKQANAAVGFSEYDLHAYAAQFNHCWLGRHLDINTIQKLATRAFQAVQRYALGKNGRPRFKGRNQMDSVEGKTNKSGIRWRDGRVKWLDLSLQAIIDPKDKVIAHGLQSRIKYVRLVRRKIKGRNRFYVQLVCEGRPYQKEKYRPGRGVVGLDIGPSTVAVVGPQEAFLVQFCAELEPRWREIRRLQRKIDRQRRANNPDNYRPDGTIKPGPKTWTKSRRQRETEAQLAEMYRRMAAYRKSLQGQLVNRVLPLGNRYQMEKLSYRAFQRRYGRSVGLRAPGMFVTHLKRKAESAGAEVVEFPTRTTRLSQVCHGCGQVEKKPLSQRWHVCACGIVAQRDLYSAFLATCVEADANQRFGLNVDLARETWSGADMLLQTALSQICPRGRKQPASDRRLPASFGLSSGQRQSGSSEESSTYTVDSLDVVPQGNLLLHCGEGEPGKARGDVGTPLVH